MIVYFKLALKKICVQRCFFIFLFIFLYVKNVSAYIEDNGTKPLYEFGAGLGYIELEHYPASNQFTWLVLPFPTFQYRGEILRADDREGARAYMLKESWWSFDFSGNIWPALSSADDVARKGMPNLPWVLALGPQLVLDFSETVQSRWSVFQAISSDFSVTKTNGAYFDARVLYKWSNEISWLHKGLSVGNITLSLQVASQDFLANYFEVNPQYSTPVRPAYAAVGGLLCDELSIFQSFHSDKAGFYFGGYWDNYDVSANRQSPLHRSDHNLTFFIGMTYSLFESKEKSYSAEKTEGLINHYYEKYYDKVK